MARKTAGCVGDVSRVEASCWGWCDGRVLTLGQTLAKGGAGLALGQTQAKAGAGLACLPTTTGQGGGVQVKEGVVEGGELT